MIVHFSEVSQSIFSGFNKRGEQQKATFLALQISRRVQVVHGLKRNGRTLNRNSLSFPRW